MKKNKMMRAAILMLVLTLVTSCFVGGTFAKYVTSKEGSDSARVAKFGVEITPNGNLFNASYTTDAADTTFTGEVSVAAEAKVVAPGTKGDLTAMTISGTPEVAVEVKYEAALTLTGWELADGAYYCPIVITVGETAIAGSNYTSIADFKAAVEAAINGYTAQYAPNQSMAGVNAPTVSWAWAIGEASEQDTYLGDQAAKDNAATIKLEIKTTVTQID